MPITHRLSVWLGRLSVGRKLMLIYLLDLTAVIYVSSILIHEKNEAIDFTRKETVGTAYASVVRDGLMGQFLHAQGAGAAVDAVLQRLSVMRDAHDGKLKTAPASQRFTDALAVFALPQAGLQANAVSLAAARSQLLRDGRELLTTIANQSNLILDPELDSYYVMSLVVLRFPELLQAVHDTMVFLQASKSARGPQWSSELLTLAGRLDAVMQGIESDYNQAFIAGTPEMHRALGGQREALKASLMELQSLLQAMTAGASRRSVADVAQQQAQ
eukprot:gene24156-24218_t